MSILLEKHCKDALDMRTKDMEVRLTQQLNPCGGGVEYLHCDPASCKRQRNGTKKAVP
jgi:hypothetical protein